MDAHGPGLLTPARSLTGGETTRGETVPFTKTGVGTLPDDKPAVYTIETQLGNPNYVGSAQRGRVQERAREHLDGPDAVPGVRVKIRQTSDINEARKHEAKLISQLKPKYNKQGKR